MIKKKKKLKKQILFKKKEMRELLVSLANCGPQACNAFGCILVKKCAKSEGVEKWKLEEYIIFILC